MITPFSPIGCDGCRCNWSKQRFNPACPVHSVEFSDGREMLAVGLMSRLEQRIPTPPNPYFPKEFGE